MRDNTGGQWLFVLMLCTVQTYRHLLQHHQHQLSGPLLTCGWLGGPLSRLSSFTVCLSLRVFSGFCWTGGWAPPRPPERPGMVGQSVVTAVTSHRHTQPDLSLAASAWY